MTSRYYTMTDSTGESGFLPTVVFDGSSGVFTSAHRTNTLKSIGITGLYEADFSNTVTAIDLSAFAFDASLVIATINGVRSIRSDAFYGCSALRAITLDCSVNASKKYLLTDISSGAFQGCTSLRNLHIPDTVTIIPDYMCYDCTSLEVAVMGYGWDRAGDTYNRNATIGQYAFANCSRLSYFVIPETVKNVYDFAFNNDPSLSYVAFLGRPDVSANVFKGTTMNSATAIYTYDMSKNNLTSFATDISAAVPTLATRRVYREFTISGNANSGLSVDYYNYPTAITTAFPAFTTTSWWKAKIASGVTKIEVACFRSHEIVARYPFMIGMSFPSSLNTIGYEAFSSWNISGTYPATNAAAFYFPNALATFDIWGGGTRSSAFDLYNETARNNSTTKQFVFQSGGTSTVALRDNTFYYTSALAIIAPNATSFGINCFAYANKVQLYSFFQKNAYTATTRLDDVADDVGKNAFSYTFNKGVAGYTHYLYIPKQITRMALELFRGITDKIYVTAYHNTISTTGVTAAASGLGFGFFSYNATILTANTRFTGTAPTLNIIYNYVDANGATVFGGTGIGNEANFLINVLYPSNVKTINQRFNVYTYLNSVAVDHNASQTVVIADAAFTGCTRLKYLYFNNRVKTIGFNAFRNTELSNSFDLIDAHPLEQIHHAAFFTDSAHGASSLTQITIPNTVKILGAFVLSCGTTGKKPSFTTLSFENGIEFWGDYDNNNNQGASSAIANYGTLNSSNVRHMAIPYQFCINCDNLTSVSFLNTALDQAGTPVPNNGSALARQDNTRPMLTRYNTQILNPVIKRISNGAFQTNHRLQSIRVPEGITIIDSNAFFETYSLTYLYLPDTLTSIALNAFSKMNFDNKFSYTGKEVSVRVPQSRIDDVANASVVKFNPESVSTYFINVSYDNTSASGKVALGILGRFTTSAVDPYIKYHVITLTGITGILGGSTANQRAFDGITSLKTVTIANTVTSIGQSAFSGCTGLTDVSFSATSGLVSIGPTAFSTCTSLTTITIPSLVTDISTSAFASLTGLTRVSGLSTGTTLVNIGNSAFESCSGLTDISMNRVKSIGVNAFRNARLSNSFDLSGATSLEAIYNAAFMTDTGNTSNLQQITIPGSVKAIGSYVFASSSLGLKPSFTTLSFENGIAFWGDYDNTIFTTTTITGYGSPTISSARYMAIPAYFCINCDNLTNISFLNTVDANNNAIPNDGLALSRPDNSLPILTRLNSQTLTTPIKRIGKNAFQANHRLQSIRIPQGVTTIDVSGFYDAHSLSYLYLPDSLTTIGLDAFDNLGIANKFSYIGREVSVRIPQLFIDDISANKFSTNNVSTIYATVAFDTSSGKVSGTTLGRFTTSAVNTYFKYHVITLTGITGILGGSTANQRAFDGFTNLKTVTIANTVTSIGASCLSGCTGLTNIFFSPTSTLPSIGASAFSACTGLTTITIPDSVTSIGASAFSGDTGLTSVLFSATSGLVSIGSTAFSSCNNLTTITIPSLVTDISTSAFASLTGLTRVSFSTPGSFVNIGSSAFSGCTALTDISMNRVKSIGRFALSDVPLSNTFDLSGATSLEAIYTSAFATFTGISNLRQITIPLSVKVLGANAFGSTALGMKPFFTTLSFETGIAFWGDYDYALGNASTTAAYGYPNTSSPYYMAIPANFCQNCDALTSIANVLNKNPLYIGDIAFSACKKITTITIPNAVTTIGALAFSDCSGLTSVSFSPTGSLVTIGSSAFYNCTALTDISMNRAKSIGTSAFRNARLSNTFDLSGATSLEAIYNSAFYTDVGYTSNIRQITIPGSVKALGSNVFASAALGLKTSFTTLSFDTGIAFWGDYNNTLTTTSTITGYGSPSTSSAYYMAIPANFCQNCNFLTSISFLNTAMDVNGTPVPNDGLALSRPNNSSPITIRYNTQTLTTPIKRIGTSAFVANHRLQSIRIPQGVTTIDVSGFYDAHSLSYLYLPDSLTAIGLDAFDNLGIDNKFSYTGKEVSVRIPQLFIDDISANKFSTVSTIYATVAFDTSSGKVSGTTLGRFTTSAVNTYFYYHVITLTGITGILGGVTANQRAFDGITSLKTLTIANTVTSIGVSCLSGCTGLTNVSFSSDSSLVSIGPTAFTNCTSLTTITIPSLVTDISTSAFANLTGLTRVSFSSPGSLVNIGSSAFNNCTALTDISMNRIKSIGVNAFRNARLSNTFDLTSATSLEAIYHAAFYTDVSYTSNIRQITIPSSIKTLGSYVFGSGALGLKTSFTTLSFENGIAFWGDYDNSFAATTFTDVSLGSARYMAIPAFFCINCDYLNSISFLNTVDASGAAITADAGGALTRPDNSLPILTRLNKQTLTTPFKRIGTGAFQSNHRVQSIRIPDGVTTIDASGFFDAHSLSYLYLPDSLTTIGLDAFDNLGTTNKFLYTGKEVSIRIPQSRIDDVSSNKFSTNNVSTYYVTVPFDNTSSKVTGGVLGRFTTQPVNTFIKYHVVTLNGITGILGGSTAGARAFDGITSLKTVTIADTVTDIGVSCLSGCTGLTNTIILPTSNLTSVGNSAFQGDVSLTSFFIPNSLDGINATTFSGCTSLASVTYGNNPGIKYIGNQAFYMTTKTLTSIFIPSSVVSIGSQAFITDTSATLNILNTVTFGAGSRLRSIAGQCFGHYNSGGVNVSASYLRDLVLPNTIRAIGTSEITETTRAVFRNAFTKSHSANLVLPSSLEYLSESIFYSDNVTTNRLDISNIYLPLSITNVAGPRNHSGYTTNGIALSVFSTSSSKSNSLIYLPSHLSGYTGGGATAFPDASRNRCYYRTASFTTNPLLTLGLIVNVANTTDPLNTTQIHADIKEGVVVIGGGTNNITSLTGDGSRNLISVNIPSTVTTISANAFNGCTALAYVTFSENSKLTTIGNSAFLGCSLIPDIQLPDTLTTIGPNAFSGCNNLASISIPYNVTSIGANAFAGTFVRTRYVRLHQKLYNDISGSLSTYFPGVSASSFQVIPALTLTNTLNPSRLTISQINNMYIRYRQSQLGGCTFITVSATSGSMLTPADVTTALSGSTGLVHLEIGSNVTDISKNVCYNNSNTSRIYSVAIPKTVTTIGSDAFNGCTNLSYLSFHPDSACQAIGQGAFLGTNIFDLALPDSLTSISGYAFQASNRLTSACIPKNVTSLGTGAFYFCPKLTSVALPASLAYATYANATYFSTDSSGTTAPGTFTTYDLSAAIPHFKLSDYSLPNGIVQNVVDSAVTYIDHRAYAYYPDITLYAVTTYNQTKTAGQYNYVMNGIKMPFQPAVFIMNGGSSNNFVSNSMFPIYRSVPDLNVFSLSSTAGNWPDDQDDYYILMPGYSICIYNNLYDEENLFTTNNPTYLYYDNEFGKVPLNIANNGFANTTSSILIMYNGRILSKYYTS